MTCRIAIAISPFFVFVFGCSSEKSSSSTVPPVSRPSANSVSRFSLRSDAFGTMQTIPIEHRHTDVGGKNQSPPLQWTDPPAPTKTFALVCVDPDAPGGDFVHWVVYNLPAETRRLEGGLSREPTLANGSSQGKNDFDQIGYDGPAPPPGKPHHYIFRLYALDTKLNLPAEATREQLEKAMQGHIVGQAELVGVYEHKE